MRLFKFIAPLLLGALAPLFLICAPAQAKDGFETVRCGGDVRAALIGKHQSNERVVVLEARHKALGLKDLGGEIITDHLNSVEWQVCGKTYVVLTNGRDVVTDVLAMPAHSRAFPESVGGSCWVAGRPVDGIDVAILDNQAAAKAGGEAHYGSDDKTPLPATAAWKINVKTGKFVAFPAKGLTCARGGIVTADGGQ